jgi:putative alpha-1,2-mannosidase
MRLLRGLGLAKLNLAALLGLAATASAGLTDYVDTRIGTGGVGFGVGEVPVGAQVPFGSCRIGPDTSLGLGFDLLYFYRYGGYYAGDDYIRAMSHTHTVGAGVDDYGNFGVIPVHGDISVVDSHLVSDANYRSKFSHDGEVASPGYYAVDLQDAGARAEVVAVGPFSGMHRYTCGGGSHCSLLLDVCHTATKNSTDTCRVANMTAESVPPVTTGAPWAVRLWGGVVNHGSLSGRSQFGQGVNIYFSMLVEPLEACGFSPSQVVSAKWEAGSVFPPMKLPPSPQFSSTLSGSLGIVIGPNVTSLVPTNCSGFSVRAAVSFVSPSLAWQNLLAEQQTGQGTSFVQFDAAHVATTALWESMLSRVQVQDPFPALTNLPTAEPSQMPQLRMAPEPIGPVSLDAAERLSRHQALVDTVEGPTPRERLRDDWNTTQLTKFYTAAYHSWLAPSIFSESNGQYMSFAGDARAWGSSDPASRYRTDMSLWDIHRSQAAWLALTSPSDARDVTNSLVRMAHDGGKLPRWPLANVYTGCMVGSHGVSVMAGAVLRGVGGIDSSAVLEVATRAVNSQASESQYGTLGWIPAEERSTAASDTMDFAFDDGVVANLAKRLGNASAGAAPSQRAANWQNVITSLPGLVGPFPLPRFANGTFYPSPAWLMALPYPLETQYTEGDGWQYRWFAPAMAQSIPGLFPSIEDYVEQLDLFMNQSLTWPLGGEKSWLPNAWYWAGNEPDIFAPWQFVYAGNDYAYKTQYWARAMSQTAYDASYDGLPGNDDFGTMSAWLAFSMIGIYPVPGTDQFIVSSPAFASASLTLPLSQIAVILGFPDFATAASAAQVDGVSPSQTSTLLSIVTINASPDASLYASGATLNGKPLASPFVTQADLLGLSGQSRTALFRAHASGTASPSTLQFTMSATPQPWG